MPDSDHTLAEFTDAAPPVPSAAPARIAGRYELLGLLGHGGMGTVYRVRDVELDEVVALKLLRRDLLIAPGALDRFRQEVKLARRVTHPNVVRTFDLGEHQDERFLTMEYVDGHPLSRRIADGALSEAECAEIGGAICAGVGAAHRAGVLHRDLKPDNVLVGQRDATGAARIAITDFGIAIARGAAASGLVGTPAYMSPEQVQGRDVDARSDVYAIGAILYELVTGVRAFVGDDPMAVAAARLDAPPPDPRQATPVSDALAGIILRCLAVEPRYRYGNVDEIAVALSTARVLPAAPRAAAPAILSAGARTLAVLPLRAAAEDAPLAEGLAEELCDLLSAGRGLKVRPYAAVRREGADDPLEAGRRLDVEAVLTGTLRRQAGQVVVTVRLLGVNDGFQIFGRRIACTEADLLVAADGIASDAAAALAEHIRPPPREVADGRAVAIYLRARYEYRLGFESGTLDAALASAEEGLAIAPDDPSLLAVYAMICARLAFYGNEHGAQRLSRAAAAAARAVQAAPKSAEAHLASGTTSLYAGDAPAAARSLRIATELSPGLARAQDLYGGMLIDIGRVDEGVARLEAAISLDPVPWFVRADLARGYAYQQNWKAVRDTLTPTSDPGGLVIAAEYRARFALWSPAAPRAFQLTRDDIRKLFPDEHPGNHVTCALIEANFSGSLSDELDAECGVGLERSRGRLRAACGQFLAEARSATGRIEGALDAVASAVGAGLYDAQWIERCPALDPLREHPRFAPLQATVSARAAAIRAALAPRS